MNLDSQVKLGQSTNLLAGYKADIFSVPFTLTDKPALYEKPVIVKSNEYVEPWSFPTITLHENVQDLLSAVFQVKLRPNERDASAIWPSGGLVLAGLTDSTRQKALEDLSSQLGIDLSKDDQSFALVRLTRKMGTSIHPCYERGIFGHPDPDNTVTPDALAVLKSLVKLEKTSTDVSKDGANGYLNFYKTYGSHFVSSIDAGDSIFQVFAYAAKDFNYIVDYYLEHADQLSGYKSQSFCIYTVPLTEDHRYGYTSAIGKICINSGDPEMEKSLKAEKWFERHANTDSVFAPYFRSDSVDINAVFKQITVTSIELASLEKFAEYYRMLIWRKVFKGAMYTKYSNGSGVVPYFNNNCPYDLNLVYKDSDPIDGDGFLSTLATPTVNIWQEKIDLSTIVLQFPELVKEFSVFSSGIQIPTPKSTNKKTMDVPGSSIVSLIGHVISSGSLGPIPPTLRLTDSAFSQVKDRLFCGEFYGGLRITNSDGSKIYVIMDGLIFEESKGTVDVVRDARDSPSKEVLTARLTDMQFALVAAEARLNFLLANTNADQVKSLELTKRFLLWLARVAGSHGSKEDHKLSALQARALYLATVASNEKGNGIPVPYLRYESYKDVVSNVQKVIDTVSDKLTVFQKQIRERKAEERQIDREKALNENIIISGKLLQDYIGTQASYQQSMQDMFSSVVKDKEKQLDLASKQLDKLKTSLNEQKTAVNDAITKYQDAVADWQKKETLKAAIDIASNMFSLGFAFVTPSSTISALASLGKTVQKVQKAVKVFDAVIKAYRSIKALPSNPQQVVSALKDIGPSGVEIPSLLEWNTMKLNFDSTLSTGPQLSAKTSLSTAFAILVLRGKALLQCQSTVQKIAADLSAANQQMTLHEEQKKRLDDLKVNLSAQPDKLQVSSIDLIGLSGQLVFFQRQMLMILASTVVIQDRALQYEYLRPPTPVGSFTMLNLQLAILNQSRSINNGLTAQPQPREQNDPIIYEIHGVKQEQITNDQRYTFDIPVNKREFASYNYVRVKNVQVEIGGIASTKSGKYYTELVFDGNPFYDRGFDGEILEFQTTSRIFTGLHEVSSSRHEFSGVPEVVENANAYLATTDQDPFSGKISDITPFSKWQVSLPKTQSNADIKFDDNPRGVTVRIIFHIYAQLKEKSISPVNYSLLNAPPPSDAYNYKAVLGSMSGKSVCGGWDVVFSMTAKQVNTQLEKQYHDRVGNPKFMRKTGDYEYKYKNSMGNCYTVKFHFSFDAPRLQFLLNNSRTAEIYLPIKEGHYEKWVTFKGDTTPHLESDISVTKEDKASVQGDVPLVVMSGSVSTQHNVAAKLNGKGSFKILNFKAFHLDAEARLALDDYFSNLKDGYEVYSFGTLDFKETSVLNSLTPTHFKFYIHESNNKGSLLQLFIATTGEMFKATSLTLVDPIPNEYESSLIINSKLFFTSVLPASLGDGGIGLKLESIEPTDDHSKEKAWSSKATAGSISAPFAERYMPPIKRASMGTVPGNHCTKYYVKVKDNKVTVDLTNMEYQPGDKNSDWQIQMLYDVKDKSYDYQSGSRKRDTFTFKPDTPWSSLSWESKTYSLGVNLKIDANFPFDISGSERNQSIQGVATTSIVTLDGNLEPPAGACHCNDRDLQKSFMETLKKTLPDKLVEMFNHPFPSVSLFALKNLLFPGNNFIDMKKVYVPGDMVIFGNFT